MSTEPASLIPPSPMDVQFLRFGPFELDLDTSELRKAGARVRIQLQPFKVLAVLALNQGRLVTREELQREVWPEGTFVDFEQSLNFCIRQVRSALGDQAESPHYVETLPRRGYRFIAPVERVSSARLALATTPPGGVPTMPLPLAEPEPARQEPDPPESRSPAGLLRLVPWALAGGLAAALAVALRPAPASAPAEAPVFRRVTFQRGAVSSACFGPAAEIVYAAAWDGNPQRFWLSQPDQRETRPLDLEGNRVVGVGPQGEVAWLRRKGGGHASLLLRAPLLGGPEKAVLEGVVEATWMPDGREFAVARSQQGRLSIEFPAGHPVASVPWASSLRVSRDGTRLAYFEQPVAGDDRGDLVVVDRAGQRRVLAAGWGSAQGLAWSPTDDEVWFTAAHSGADLALHAADLQGRVRDLVPAMGRLVLHDVTADGRVLIERNTTREELRLLREGEPERDLSWLDISRVEDISADGRLVLFGESGEGAGPDYAVFLRGADGGVPLRLGPGVPLGLAPDGSWAAATPIDRSRLDILPVGPGEVRTLDEPGLQQFDWADGLPGQAAIVFTARVQRNGPPRVYVRDLAHGPARPVTPEGVGVFRNTLSLDGRWLVAGCPGADERLCRYGLEPGAPAPQPLAAAPYRNAPLSWSPDGRLLRVREMSGTVAAHLGLLDLATGVARPWRELLPDDRAGVVAVAAVVTTPDARTIAYSVRRQISDLYVATHVR